MDVNGEPRPRVAGATAPARSAPGRSPGRGGTLELIAATDDAGWAAVLAEVAEHDFHHLAGYHRLAEYRGEGTAQLFVYRGGGHVIGVPLLLRPVDPGDPAGPQDATSVYGYAGPVSSTGPIPAEVVSGFQAALRDELVRRRVVTVFSRLHPLLLQQHLVSGLGETGVVGPTVSVDLTLPAEEQWGGYNKGTRRLIRRATEAGVTCVHDLDLDYLDEWVDLYRETMERLGASSSYHFDAGYFGRMIEELRPVLHLFVALVDGRVASAGLFTLCRGIVQAHLGGSRQAFSSMSPGRVVDDTARRWAHEAGARVFHLGGGVGGHQDSLFQYKAGFSDRRHQFATWRWIVDEAAYADLCARHGAGAGPDSPVDPEFFPAYRRSGDPGR